MSAGPVGPERGRQGRGGMGITGSIVGSARGLWRSPRLPGTHFNITSL